MIFSSLRDDTVKPFSNHCCGGLWWAAVEADGCQWISRSVLPWNNFPVSACMLRVLKPPGRPGPTTTAPLITHTFRTTSGPHFLCSGYSSVPSASKINPDNFFAPFGKLLELHRQHAQHPHRVLDSSKHWAEERKTKKNNQKPVLHFHSHDFKLVEFLPVVTQAQS